MPPGQSFAHYPPEQVAAVRQAVSHQFPRLLPSGVEPSHAAVDRLVETVLAGKQSTAAQIPSRQSLVGPRVESPQEAARRGVGGMVDTLAAATPDQYLAWEESDRHPRLYEGYRGPGWSQDEARDLTPVERRKKLAPGEYWDRQNARHIRLLRRFLDSDPNDQPVRHGGPSLGSFGQAGMGYVPPTPTARQAEMDIWNRGDGAVWRTGSPNLLDSRNLQLLGGNYAKDDLGAHFANPDIEASAKAIAEPLDRTDHRFGAFVNAIDTTSRALRGATNRDAPLVQGVYDAVLRARVAGDIARVSPFMPFEKYPSSPGDAVRALAGLRKAMDDIEPLNEGEAHYLNTGQVLPLGTTVAMRAVHDAADLMTLASMGVTGAGALGSSGVRAVLPALARETLQEAGENAVFQGPAIALQAGNFGEGDVGGRLGLKISPSTGTVVNQDGEWAGPRRGEMRRQYQEGRQRARHVLQALADPPPQGPFEWLRPQ